MDPQNALSESRRQFTRLGVTSLLLPVMSGCGGGGSTPAAGGSSVTPITQVVTPGTAILTSSTLNDGTVAITSKDTASGLSSVFYSQQPVGNVVPPVRSVRVESPSGTANFFFNDTGTLSQWTEPSTGISTVVTTFSDRVEARSYRTSGEFDSGTVVYSSGGRWYAGLLSGEEYSSVAALANVVEITSQLRQAALELIGSTGPIAMMSLSRRLFALLPLSSASAEESLDQVGKGLITSIAAQILTYVFVPLALGIAVGVITKSPKAGAADTLILAALQVSRSKAATPGPTPPPAPIPLPGPNGIAFGFARYAGDYSGSFSGRDSGSFSIMIASNRSITGSGLSVQSGGFGLSGSVGIGGKTSVSTGTTSAGSSFSGIVDTRTSPFSLSGTWSNAAAGLSGTYVGRKL